MDRWTGRGVAIAAAALVLGAFAGVAPADDAKKQEARAPEGRRYSPALEEMRETVADRVHALADKLGLTDEQRTKIRDSQAEFAEKVQNLRTERRELLMDELKAMGETLTPEQREQAKAFIESRVAAAKEGAARGEWPDVGYSRSNFPEMMQAAADKLGLSREQRNKIMETHAAYREKARSQSDKARQLVAAQMQTLGGVLTEEQRSKLRAATEGRVVHAAAAQSVGERLRMLGDKLGLNDEQRKRIRETLGSYGEKYRTMAEERRDLMQEEMKAVASILTEDQREKVRDFMEDRVVVIGVDVDPSKPDAVAQLKETVGERLQAVADRLGLTEEQRTKIREAHAGFEQKYQAQRTQRRELREREIKDLGEILTPEQREKVKTWVEDRVG